MASRMHQTTIRFVPRAWREIELEAGRQGVSSAQYVRDATLSRLVHDSQVRGGASESLGHELGRGQTARPAAGEQQMSAHAAGAQARLAEERARETREAARRLHSLYWSSDAPVR